MLRDVCTEDHSLREAFSSTTCFATDVSLNVPIHGFYPPLMFCQAYPDCPAHYEPGLAHARSRAYTVGSS